MTMESVVKRSNSYFTFNKKSNILLKNVSEKANVVISYKKINDKTVKLQTSYKNINWTQVHHLKSIMKEMFLPKGYPHSVSNDYLEYQIWDTCQAFCSSICGILSMSAIMEGVGVGSQTASPVSAAITWIMKDGTGMLGSIIFTWLKGSRLDSDCKKWRLFADILNDAALCLELCIPIALQYSMYILCLATAMKALVGVAGSATRAAVTCHQAIKGNMADVSAKDGSQEVFVNICAYLFGVFLLKHIANTDKTWAVMCTFILLHIFSNYKAVSCLKINVYNGERYRLSLRSFLSTSDVPTVEQVNRNESVFLGMGTCDRELFGFTIRLGVSLEHAVVDQKLTVDDVSFLIFLFQSKNYFLVPHVKKREILISFRRHILAADIMKGYFHAALAGAAVDLEMEKHLLRITKRKRNNSPLFRLEKSIKEYQNMKSDDIYRSKSLPVIALLSCQEVIEREFTLFCKLSTEKYWNIQQCLLVIDDWTSDWKYEAEKNRNHTTDHRNSSKAVSRV